MDEREFWAQRRRGIIYELYAIDARFAFTATELYAADPLYLALRNRCPCPEVLPRINGRDQHGTLR